MTMRTLAAVVLLVLLLGACGGKHPPTEPSATINQTAVAPATVTLPKLDDHAATAAAVRALFGSLPPYGTTNVTSGRYVRTNLAVAQAVVLGRADPDNVSTTTGRSATRSAESAWLFVFTGAFYYETRFHPETRGHYSTAVVAVYENYEGVMNPVAEPPDLTALGSETDIPSSELSSVLCQFFPPASSSAACSTPVSP